MPTISFRCEGCTQRIVCPTAPVVHSPLAMGCTLACTLQAVEQRYRVFKKALALRQFDPSWQAQMMQAEMRPQQWLKLVERELHDEVARLRALVHRETLAREHPDLVELHERVLRWQEAHPA